MKQLLAVSLAACVCFCASAKTKWTQQMLPGTKLFPSERLSKANWIWHASDRNASQYCYVRLHLDLPEEPVKAIAYATFEPHSVGDLYVNGIKIKRGYDDRLPRFRGHVKANKLNLLPALKKGKNVIAAYSRKAPASKSYGLICGGDIVLKSGKVIRLGTDETFKASPFAGKDWMMPGFDDSKWKPALVRGGVRYSRFFRYGDVPRMYCSDAEYKVYLARMKRGSELPAGIEKEPAPEAKIVYNGITPGIRVAGKVLPPFIHKGQVFTNARGPVDQDDDCVAKMYKAGLRVFHVGYTISSFRTRAGNDAEYDYAELGRRIERILAICPEARIIIAPFYDIDPVWIKQNPEELVGFARKDSYTGYGLYGGNPKVPSFASPKFRKVLTDELNTMAAFCKNKPWYNRVIGVLMAYGPSADGMPFACHTGMPDTGKHMTAYFRQYLKNKYKTNAALQKAWNDPKVTFETAAVPNKEERYGKRRAFLRDLKNERKLMDYYHSYHENFSEFHLEYCKAVKKALPGRLSAIFFGDVLLPYATTGLTAYYEKLLKDPAVDIFYCTSQDYFKRSGLHRNIYNSFHKAGKLTSCEADLRTHVGFQEGTVEKVWAFKTPEETRAGVRKVMANALMHGGTAHFNPHGYLYNDRFNCPEVYETIEDGIKIWKRLFNEKQPAKETVETVVVWDERSKILHGYPIYSENSVAHNSLIPWTLEAMDFSGIPYKLMTFREYLAQNKDYKTTVFLNLFTVTEAQKKEILKRVRKKGHTVIWNYAAGLCSPDGYSEKTMRELFGMDYKVSWQPRLWTNKNIYGETARSSGRTDMVPWIYTEDKNTEVLSNYTGDNKIASVVKKLPGGSFSVVLGVPEVNKALWPYLLTLSKNHQYAEGDVFVLANERMLMIYMPKAGKYTIRLPRKAAVTDLFGDMKPLGKTDRFTLTVTKDHQTRLFELK